MITGNTAVYGLFGYPVAHTFSPGMHNAAFAKLAMRACYVPFPVEPERLESAMQAIPALGLQGVNVTVPHKEKVIQYLDDLAEDARLIGAVNTIQVRNGRLTGHNTDGRGFLRSLKEETSFRPKGKTVLIVGAGGAARAVAFTLAQAGGRHIVFHDTDAAKAERLAADIRMNTASEATCVGADDLGPAASVAHCIINATPLGMRRQDALPLPTHIIQPGHLVCDLVYNPPSTALLRQAITRRAAALSGIGMLLFQGVIAFEIWTGRKAPVATMRRALVQQMPRGGK